MRRQRRMETFLRDLPLVGSQAEKGLDAFKAAVREYFQPPAFFETARRALRRPGRRPRHRGARGGAAQRHRVRRPDRRPRPHPEGPRLPAGRGRRREAPPRRTGVRSGGRSTEGGAHRLHAGVRRGGDQGGRAREPRSWRSPRPCPGRPACSRSRSGSPTASSTSASPSSTPSPRPPAWRWAGCGPSSPSTPRSSTGPGTRSSTTSRCTGCPCVFCARPRRDHRRRRRQPSRRLRHGTALPKVPGMTVLAPSSAQELQQMLHDALGLLEPARSRSATRRVRRGRCPTTRSARGLEARQDAARAMAACASSPSGSSWRTPSGLRIC